MTHAMARVDTVLFMLVSASSLCAEQRPHTLCLVETKPDEAVRYDCSLREKEYCCPIGEALLPGRRDIAAQKNGGDGPLRIRLIFARSRYN